MKTNNIQTRNAEVKPGSVNEEDRTAVFVISSEDVDSYKTVFRSDGWDFTEYNSNPVVAYNHRAGGDDPDNVIGTTIDIWKEGKLTLAKVRFEDAETNPKAEKIMRKLINNTLRMASINALVSKARMGLKDQGEDPDVVYFTQQHLREWSVVDFGSNPSALKRNSDELEVLRSAAVKEIEVAEEPAIVEEKRASLDVFEAQLIINQNRLVK